MTFNAGKSEMMQLAGRISQHRPEVLFAGGVLKWVTEFKYLGVPITQGRRKRIPLPKPQLWQSYHRIHDVLRGPYPLLDQLMLVKATMLNVTLYPAAVRNVDYDAFGQVPIQESDRHDALSIRTYQCKVLACGAGAAAQQVHGSHPGLELPVARQTESMVQALPPVSPWPCILQQVAGYRSGIQH